MSWIPGTYNITAQRYATFDQTLTLRNENGNLLDLSGYTAAFQVRQTYSSSTAVISLTQASGITLGGALGTVRIVVTDEATSAIEEGNYVYDLVLTTGGVAKRWLQGKFTLTAGVTHG